MRFVRKVGVLLYRRVVHLKTTPAKPQAAADRVGGSATIDSPSAEKCSMLPRTILRRSVTSLDNIRRLVDNEGGKDAVLDGGVTSRRNCHPELDTRGDDP